MIVFVAVLVPVAFGLCLWALSLDKKVKKIMKEDHEQTWNSIGRPEYAGNDSIYAHTKFFKFLWTKADMQLENPELSKVCSQLRIISIAYCIAFFVLVALYFVFLDDYQF